MSKHISNKYYWFILILSVSIFLRFYRISLTTDFNYDQARSATFAKEIANGHKMILIGPDSIIGSKTIYHGPLYFYLIAPGLKLANYNPLGADYSVALLGVIAVFAVYFLTKNWLSTLLFAVFPITVIYSRWAWSPNPQPLFAALSLFFLNRKRFVLAGIFCGLTVQLHILAGIMFLPLLIVLLVRHQVRKGLIWLLLGILIGFSPVIFFNFRHSFIGLSPLLQIFPLSENGRGINTHYFLWILPFLALACNRMPRWAMKLLIAISFVVSCYIVQVSFAPPERLPSNIGKISEIIAADQIKDGKPFNVASFSDPDTRATAYRYFLGLSKLSPLGIDKYKDSNHIYILSFESGNTLLYNETYEIASFKPIRFVTLGSVKKINIYKLYNK